jgi:hypothetical protein
MQSVSLEYFVLIIIAFSVFSIAPDTELDRCGLAGPHSTCGEKLKA